MIDFTLYKESVDPDTLESETQVERAGSAYFLRDLLELAGAYGIGANGANNGTRWWQSESQQDYRTGEYVSYSLHLQGKSTRHFDRVERFLR